MNWRSRLLAIVLVATMAYGLVATTSLLSPAHANNGGSISFNGTNQYLSLPGSSDWAMGTGDFTVEWFQYQTSFSSNWPRIFTVGTYPSSFGVSIEGGVMYVWLAGGWRLAASVGAISNQWATTVGLAVMLLGWPSPAAAANDLNCTDFGTRERAQREYLKNASDIYRLDADKDGKACEWNGSTGWWVWPIAGVALVVGRAMGRRRVGDHRMVPGAQGVVFNYEFSEDGQADKVLDRTTPILLLVGVIALPVTTVLRDYVFPRSATPIAFYIAIGVLGGAGTYFTTLKMPGRDLYVAELASEDEGEL